MKDKKLATVVSVGLMAALCFVGNYLQIKIPNGVLITRIHFGNSMCVLAGLLFGSLVGGLASGIGAGLYDLLDPVYIVSSPVTFLTKFAMGWVAGYLSKSSRRLGNETAHIAVSAVLGQLTYIVLYVGKTYVSQRILGYEVGTALTASATNLLTSTVNAVISVIVSVPLYFALVKPLKATYFRDLVDQRREKSGKNWWILIAAAVFIALLAVAVWFGAVNKK